MTSRCLTRGASTPDSACARNTEFELVTGTPGVGKAELGDLRRLRPISRDFGADRGQPVDRFYIQRFLFQHAGDVKGAVLEVGEDTYTRRYGGDRVHSADILHVTNENPMATIVADLTDRTPAIGSSAVLNSFRV